MKYCDIGGQAVLEGVMMKSKAGVALAVRTPDGKISLEKQKKSPSEKAKKISRIPIVRGAVNLVLTMIEGVKILMHSAELIGEEEDYQPSKFEKWISEKLHIKIMDVVAFVAVVLALALFIGLFILLPTFIAGFLPKSMNTYLRSLVEGLMRIIIFIGYLMAVSCMKDIKRTFMYHGAEHKTIACYEHEMELTPENAAKCSRLHPRCGTSFMLIVMIIAILIYGLFPIEVWWQRMLVRILMLPVVAGVSYEVLKLLAKSENIIVRALRAPGLALQRLTTKEPTNDMLEVAITSFKGVLVMEGLLPEGADLPAQAAEEQVSENVSDIPQPGERMEITPPAPESGLENTAGLNSPLPAGGPAVEEEA